jgi:hypothetical protein
MWINPPIESWMTVDKELPQRVLQTIRETQSRPMVFFNPKEFALVNLFPHGTPFIAAYCIHNVVIRLANQHPQPRGTLPVAHCTCISTIPSATLLGMW